MENIQPLPAVMRCRFTKTGLIRCISHLDLTRTFHRALARAQIPLKFSEGFSPHPKFTLALPLSVGVESLCEIADFTLRDGADLSPGEIQARLSEQLPAGIEVLSVEKATEKLNRIAYARYEIFLPKTPPSLLSAVKRALSEPLLVEKKNKKGKPVIKDLSPGIHKSAVEPRANGLFLTLTLGAGGENVLGPDTVLAGLEKAVPGFDPASRTAMRTCLLREDESVF